MGLAKGREPLNCAAAPQVPGLRQKTLITLAVSADFVPRLWASFLKVCFTSFLGRDLHTRPHIPCVMLFLCRLSILPSPQNMVQPRHCIYYTMQLQPVPVAKTWTEAGAGA